MSVFPYAQNTGILPFVCSPDAGVGYLPTTPMLEVQYLLIVVYSPAISHVIRQINDNDFKLEEVMARRRAAFHTRSSVGRKNAGRDKKNNMLTHQSFFRFANNKSRSWCV